MNNSDPIFQKIWSDLTLSKNIKPCTHLQGFVLGGQPGAGKSSLTLSIAHQLNGNVIIINGDEYRRYHPDFEAIQEQYGHDAPKHTASFSSEMTLRVLEKAMVGSYNIVIEGTFRTAEVPISTLSAMQQHGYSTTACIQTCPSKLSWQSTQNRYAAMLAAGEYPRHVDKAHHDLVVENLPRNADIVYLSGKADAFMVFSRQGILFNSHYAENNLPGKVIQTELSGLTKGYESVRLHYKEQASHLTDQEKHYLSEREKLATEFILRLEPDRQERAWVNFYTDSAKQIENKSFRLPESTIDHSNNITDINNDIER